MNSPAPALLIIVFIALMAGCAYFAIPPILAITNSYGTFDVEHMVVASTPAAPVVKTPFVESVNSISSDQSAAPADWKTYRNEKYGFEVRYPGSWIEMQRGAFFILESKTHQGDTAWFRADEQPTLHKSDRTVDEMRRDYDRENHDINSNARTAAEALRDIMIGNEHGLEDSGIACEQADPCYATFSFWSNELSKRGFELTFIISAVDSKGIYNNATSAQMFHGDDPYALFKEEVNVAHKILSTFKFIK